MGIELAVGFLISALVSFAATAYQIYQQKKAAKEAKKNQDFRRGFETPVEGEPENLPIVYGRAKIGGIRVFHQTQNDYKHATPNSDKSFQTGPDSTSSGSYFIDVRQSDGTIVTEERAYSGHAHGYLTQNINGDSNEFLFFQQALCLGPIQAVRDVIVNSATYLDDPALGHDKYDSEIEKRKRSAMRIDCFYEGGVVDNIMKKNVAQRSKAYFYDMAYASCIVRLDKYEPQFGAVPDLSFLIEGRKVYTWSGGVKSANRTYTTNPAWCLLDYLLDNTSGKGLTEADIDISTFEAAASICGQIVQNNVAVGGKFYQTTDNIYDVDRRSLPLYECNIIVDPNRPIRDNVEAILSTMGDARLVWSAGKYKLSLQYPLFYDLGQWDSITNYNPGDIVYYQNELWECQFVSTNNPPPSVDWARFYPNNLITTAYDFTDDDLVMDQKIDVKWPSANERVNFAKVKFHNESENFKPDSVEWPAKIQGTEIRGVGGIIYAPPDGKWAANAGGKHLNSFGVWKGIETTFNYEYYFIVRAGFQGTYNLEYTCSGDINSITLFDENENPFYSSSKTDSYTNVKSAQVTLGHATEDKSYRILIGATHNVTTKKGVSATLTKDDTGVVIWSTRQPAFSAIQEFVASSDVYDAMLAEDEGMELETEIFMEGCTDAYHALAKAEETVRTSRSAFSIKFRYYIKANYLEPGDFISLQSDTLQLGGLAEDTKLLFRIEENKISEDRTGEITASRFDWTQLAWNVKDDEYIIPKGVFYNKLYPPENIQYTTDTRGVYNSSGTLTWDPVDDTRVTGYNVYIHVDGDPVDPVTNMPLFNKIGSTSQEFFILPTYDAPGALFGVSSVSHNGRESYINILNNNSSVRLPDTSATLGGAWGASVNLTTPEGNMFREVGLSTVTPATLRVEAAVTNLTPVTYNWFVDGVYQNGWTTETFIINSFNDKPFKEITVTVEADDGKVYYGATNVYFETVPYIVSGVKNLRVDTTAPDGLQFYGADCGVIWDVPTPIFNVPSYDFDNTLDGWTTEHIPPQGYSASGEDWTLATQADSMRVIANFFSSTTPNCLTSPDLSGFADMKYNPIINLRLLGIGFPNGAWIGKISWDTDTLDNDGTMEVTFPEPTADPFWPVEGVEISVNMSDADATATQPWTQSNIKRIHIFLYGADSVGFDFEVDYVHFANNGAAGLDWLDSYQVTVYDQGTATVLHQEFVKTNRFDFTFVKNQNTANGPHRTFDVGVACVDTDGYVGTELKLTPYNNPPIAPTISAVVSEAHVAEIRWQSLQEGDLAGYEVHMDTTSGFTPGAGTLLADLGAGNTTHKVLVQTDTYFFKVGAYDVFGKADGGVVYSNQYSYTATSTQDLLDELNGNIAEDMLVQSLQDKVNSTGGVFGAVQAWDFTTVYHDWEPTIQDTWIEHVPGEANGALKVSHAYTVNENLVPDPKAQNLESRFWGPGDTLGPEDVKIFDHPLDGTGWYIDAIPAGGVELMYSSSIGTGIQVTAGQQYTLSCEHRNEGYSSGGFYMDIQWLDQYGAIILDDSGPAWWASQPTWDRKSYTATAPPGALWVKLRAVSGNSVAAKFLWKNVKFEEGTGTHYSDEDQPGKANDTFTNIELSPWQFNAIEGRSVRIRLKKVGNPTWRGWLIWKTDVDDTWWGGKEANVAEPTWDGSGWGEVTFDLSAGGLDQYWKDVITAMRFQPQANDSANPDTDYYLIDYIAVGTLSSYAAGMPVVQSMTNQYTVKIDNNGNVAGFGLFNDGEVSEFAIVADQFKVVNPGTDDPKYGYFFLNTLNGWYGTYRPSGGLPLPPGTSPVLNTFPTYMEAIWNTADLGGTKHPCISSPDMSAVDVSEVTDVIFKIKRTQAGTGGAWLGRFEWDAPDLNNDGTMQVTTAVPTWGSEYIELRFKVFDAATPSRRFVDGISRCRLFLYNGSHLNSQYHIENVWFRRVVGDGEAVQVFTIGEVNGTPTVGIDGNLIVDGSFTVDTLDALSANLGTITAGTLQSADGSFLLDVTNKTLDLGTGGSLNISDGGKITFGDTGEDIVLDSLTNSIQVKDTSVVNGDYVDLSGGDITFFSYIGGQYRETKSLTRLEAGTAVNNAVKPIPGYWKAKPKVMISPANLQCYAQAYKLQDQTFSLQVLNLVESPAGSGQWQFTPKAELTLDALLTTYNSYTTKSNSLDGSSNVITTANILGDANTENVRMYFRVKSERGTGTSNEFYYRRVWYRAQYSVEGSGTWNNLTSWASFDIGANRNIHSLSIGPVNVPTTSDVRFRIQTYYVNAGGTWTSGAPAYDYLADVIESIGGTFWNGRAGYSSYIDGTEVDSYTATLPAFTPTPGYEVYQVDYSVDYYISDKYVESSTYGGYNGYARAYLSSVSGMIVGTFTIHSHYYSNPGQHSFTSNHSWSTNVYDRTITFNCSGEGESNGFGRYSYTGIDFDVSNLIARIKQRKPVSNSGIYTNTQYFDYVDAELGTGATLAEGTLNWIAIGE